MAPGFFAQIFAPETVAFAIEQSIENFPRREWSMGSVANLGALLDRPIGRQWINHRASIRRGRSQRKSEGSRLEVRSCSK